MATEYYCPACGNYHTEDTPILISPGDLPPFTCPACGTVFGVRVEFHPTGEIALDTEEE